MMMFRKIRIRDDGGDDIITYFFGKSYVCVCRQQHRRKIPVFRMKMIMMAPLIVMMMVVQMTTEVKAEEETLASQPAH